MIYDQPIVKNELPLVTDEILFFEARFVETLPKIKSAIVLSFSMDMFCMVCPCMDFSTHGHEHVDP